MHQALIEDAKHDIEGRHRGEQQQGRVALGLAVIFGGPGVIAMHTDRHADVALGVSDGLLGVAQRFAGGEVVGNRRGDVMPLMIDRQRRRAGLEMRHRRQRDHGLDGGTDGAAGRDGAAAGGGQPVDGGVAHGIAGHRRRRRRAAVPGQAGAGDGVGGMGAADGAAGGADIEFIQHVGRLPETRRHLHHHMILVQRIIDGRYRTLAECIIQIIIDLIHRQPQA